MDVWRGAGCKHVGLQSNLGCRLSAQMQVLQSWTSDALRVPAEGPTLLLHGVSRCCSMVTCVGPLKQHIRCERGNAPKGCGALPSTCHQDMWVLVMATCPGNGEGDLADRRMLLVWAGLSGARVSGVFVVACVGAGQQGGSLSLAVGSEAC